MLVFLCLLRCMSVNNNNNNNKIFIYTDKKDRSVNYIDWLVSIGDQYNKYIYLFI